MSGIAGVFRFDGAAVNSAALGDMLQVMHYRGPDGLHHWCEGPVGLAHAMLHTTTESLAEQQPHTISERGLVLVVDGYLHNWQELRRELLALGYGLVRRTDTELILAAYIQWGEQCVEHLEGDFALAIWNANTQRFFCARDRLGNRPFLYYHDQHMFAFASDLPALLALPDIQRIPNKSMFAELLSTEQYSLDATCWESLWRLPGGYSLAVTAQGVCHKQRYWWPDASAQIYYAAPEDYRDHYRELYADTIRRHSRSHLTVAFEVSGGLDSSSNFAMAHHLQAQSNLPASNILGFTQNFEGVEGADEIDYARALSQHLGRPVAEVEPSSPPLQWYERRVRLRGEYPGAPNGTAGLDLYTAASAQSCGVLINGAGGDEWLGSGRRCYASALRAGHLAWVWQRISGDIADYGLHQASTMILRPLLASVLPTPWKSLLRHWKNYRLSPPEGLRRLNADAARQWCSNAYKSEADFSYHEKAQRLNGDWAAAGNAFAVMAHEYMEVLSAEAGLELRRPYWSQAMVQFSLSIPSHLRFRRHLHRSAMESILPASVQWRASKAEFSATFDTPGQQLPDALPEQPPAVMEALLRPGAYRELIAQGKANTGDHVDWDLWYLYVCVELLAQQ